ncbi:MAG: 3-phosphoshikimate 1-carboxyvinyltransferase [Bacteroidales bacterium]|jgi:3-phosphoshikimate 1-carboxyvinyltransferase|nr:3-phosphoshikimate 1-carboxyvinyltransferase [Bacteroidales bacterium]
MQIKISPPDQPIKTHVHLPASKSISNRALIIRALSKEDFKIKNLSNSNDTGVLADALNHLSQPVINIGAAGTAMRFLTAFLSITPGERVLTGSDRMKQRPIKILVDLLRELGAKIEYLEKDGFPPLKIQGSALTSKPVAIKGNVSSQFISALLMIAPTLKNGLTLQIEDKILSHDYIGMTLKMMQYFGIATQWEGQIIRVREGIYHPGPWTVEPDWSAASYWFETVSLLKNATLHLPGLSQQSLQGDSVLTEIFSVLGVQAQFNEKGLFLMNIPTTCRRFEYDFSRCPDLAQTLTVTLAAKGIPFHLTGLDNLSIKETDRIKALVNELKKLGIHLQTNGKNYITWTGGEPIKIGANHAIKTYYDHRMAMAFAPLAINTGALIIDDPEVVKKSYPDFWNDLKIFGFKISRL